MSDEFNYSGINRENIPWYPTVDESLCSGCGECFAFCTHNVYQMDANQSIVQEPYNCVVGCSNCLKLCPTDAISFPTKELLLTVLDELKNK
ncbi:4Fe-4S dicluster domain-containing protein [Geosporobacter subterraneus DSM 17957]|uniref:4Fe-4S dicluster domain-containing protein n=1 Tax=Geosporobacter subterraneus DSM 17957 TaxID=1121919 RepID=A0A1M6PXW2_9FIRM|nr:4Fe-4S binding protein [Geosporobacter subterraneus]SHK12731.1 4Fe-4S dicluster domain-containing protein [Geosporobacter subterraneus DSM 17957]